MGKERTILEILYNETKAFLDISSDAAVFRIMYRVSCFVDVIIWRKYLKIK